MSIKDASYDRDAITDILITEICTICNLIDTTPNTRTQQELKKECKELVTRIDCILSNDKIPDHDGTAKINKPIPTVNAKAKWR